MGDVNFYLKKAEASTGKSLVYLQFKYNGEKLTFSFGQVINPKNWNKEKQRVKSNTQTTADGKYLLNDLLDNLEKECKKAYNTELKNGIPSVTTIKKYLFDFINQNSDTKTDNPNLFKLIDRFISGEIKYRGKEKKVGTLAKYLTAKNYLIDFEIKKRYKLDFDTINLDFFYKYVTFLREKGLMQNTIAKQVDHIQTFMNEAIDLEYTTNIQHRNRKFTVEWEESDSTYLTDKEISKLYRHDFSNNKKLEQVRDLFVFGCYVGLRFSDFSDVNPENIIELVDDDGKKDLFIKIKTKKTGEWVFIPCNPVIIEIFGKYEDSRNKLPRSISNQKFNAYIKDACREAKFTEKGRLVSAPEKELWECISSHSARRAFSTNLYLEGFPPIEIMKITGHKTEKAFLTYIKVTKLDAAKRLNKHFKKMWGEKLLKVA
jgi:integrase